MMLKSARKYIFCLMKRGISDHVPDILLACTSTRQVQVERKWRARAKGRAGVFLLAFALYFHSLGKGKKNHSLDKLSF